MALVQSTSFVSSVSGENHSKIMGSGNSIKNVKMMRMFHTTSLRLRSFSGLRHTNALDTAARPGQDFFPKAQAAISVRDGKAWCGAAKAMFEAFTEEAIKVILLAQDEARLLGHNYVGTEQILLGLIREVTDIAAKVLKSMGINLIDVRVEVEKIIGKGSDFTTVESPFTPPSKLVLELSREEASQLGHNYIGPEHLILGLLREGEGVAV